MAALAAGSLGFGCVAFFDFSDVDKVVQLPPDGSLDVEGGDAQQPDVLQPDAQPSDALADASDAGIVCKGTFGAPTLVPGLVPDGVIDSLPRLTPDELHIVFASNRLDGGVTDFDLYIAHRESRTSSFGTPTRVSELSSPYRDVHPWISPDLQTLFFASNRPDGGSVYRVYRATRDAAAGTFSKPIQLGVDTDMTPYPTPSMDELWFGSQRDDAGAPSRIYRAPRNGNDYGPAARVDLHETDAEFGEDSPVLSDDKLHLWFSRMAEAGTQYDIFEATRSSVTESFGTPSKVATAADPVAWESSGWISPDACRLYISIISQTAPSGIYVLERTD